MDPAKMGVERTTASHVSVQKRRVLGGECEKVKTQYDSSRAAGQPYSSNIWLNPIKDIDGVDCAEEQFHWNSFGNELFPRGFVELPYYDKKTAKYTNIKFKDRWEKWGFTLDESINELLPIGFARTIRDRKQIIGFNCAACHTAKYTYNDKTFYINGAPARNEVVHYIQDMYDSFLNLYEPKHERVFKNFIFKAIEPQTEGAGRIAEYAGRRLRGISQRSFKKGLLGAKSDIEHSRELDRKAAIKLKSF